MASSCWSPPNRKDVVWRLGAILGCLGCVLLASCDGAREAESVTLPVVVDRSGLAELTTDLGYAVTIEQARLAIADLTFSVAGEAHGPSAWRRIVDAILPRARAHPGHLTSGEVTGELRGEYLLDWTGGDGDVLGEATLLAGTYKSANFSFSRAQLAQGLSAADPLLGHTALLRGTARRASETFRFEAVFDAPAGRQLTGAPFEAKIGASPNEQVIALQLRSTDPYEHDTLFDAIDFEALAAAGAVRFDATASDPALAEASARLQRTLQTHDHFAFVLMEAR